MALKLSAFWRKYATNDYNEKESIQKNVPNKKWAEESNRHFSKEDTDGQQV